MDLKRYWRAIRNPWIITRRLERDWAALRRGGKKGVPAFIHVRKTGGTYLVQWVSSKRPVLWPLLYVGHKCVSTRPEAESGFPPPGLDFVRPIPKDEIRKHFVITTVRNPFDWLVSYRHHSVEIEPPSYYDHELAGKGFEYMVKALADREELWPSRRFLHMQLWAEDGEMIVDWISRTESLDDDVRLLAERRDLRYRREKRARQTKRGDYREYYTDELRELVQRTWQRELDLFGYDFDGVRDPAPEGALYHEIPEDRRLAVRYDWFTDTLVRDGVEIPRRG